MNTENRDKEIIELLKTLSQKEVGNIFGLSSSRISQIARKNHVKLPKYRLNMSKLNVNVDYFNNINDEKKAYWLGFICADGHIKKSNDKLAICCKDLEILEKLKNDTNSEHKICETHNFDKRTNKTYIEYSLQITNRLFVENIIKNGVTHEKSETLNFPKIDEKYYPFFIAGLFDGDGSVSFSQKGTLRCNLISTFEMLTFINDYFLKKFGWKPCKIQKVTKNNKNVYKGYWYKHSVDFLNFIYCGDKNIYLERKYERFENFKNRGLQ